MQSNAELIPNAVHDTPAPPRSTVEGLEAWLDDVQAEPGPMENVPVDGETSASDDPALSAAAAELESGITTVEPINAAEALVLGAGSSPQRLTGPDGAELVVDPEQHCYYFESTSLKPLAPLLEQPAGRWEPIYTKALLEVREAGEPQSLERLRWYAGLVATPGILDRRLHRAARYRLSRWPQVEREFPKHFRIAKAMLNKAATVDEVGAESGAPWEDVADFINACHAAGRLVDDTPPAVEAAAAGSSRKERLIAILNKPLFARGADA